MTNKEKILNYLRYMAPNRITNGELRMQTGIRSHQQVYVLTQELQRQGQIHGSQDGREWFSWCDDPLDDDPGTFQEAQSFLEGGLTPKAFENLARTVMGRHFGVALSPGQVSGVPKQFDMVSADGAYVGDAKFYTLVRGERLPPAKFATIAEYVWLLEKTGAAHRFLVFGNDPNVPRWWLQKYGELVDGVALYFLDEDGELELLNG